MINTDFKSARLSELKALYESERNEVRLFRIFIEISDITGNADAWLEANGLESYSDKLGPDWMTLRHTPPVEGLVVKSHPDSYFAVNLDATNDEEAWIVQEVIRQSSMPGLSQAYAYNDVNGSLIKILREVARFEDGDEASTYVHELNSENV